MYTTYIPESLRLFRLIKFVTYDGLRNVRDRDTGQICACEYLGDWKSFVSDNHHRKNVDLYKIRSHFSPRFFCCCCLTQVHDLHFSLSLSLFLASSNLIQFCPCRSLCNFSASLNIHVGNYATTIVNLMGQTMPTLYQPIKLQQAIKYELYRKVDTQQQVSLCSPPPSPFSVCVCVYISP